MFRRAALYIGIAVLFIFIIVALFAPFLAPYPPEALVGVPLEPPNSFHLLGTNLMGQDLLSMLIYGTRASLLTGFLGGLLAVTIGTALGIISGYYGGKVDQFLTMLINIIMTIPMFPLILLLAVFFSTNILFICIFMGLLGWTQCARIIRSQVISLSELDFVYGAKAIGASDLYIMIKHILPNVLPLAFVRFVFAVQGYMLMVVGLGFLGLSDPTMINDAYSGGGFALGLWWWLLPPGLVIVVLTLAISMFGYSMEERIAPRLKSRLIF